MRLALSRQHLVQDPSSHTGFSDSTKQQPPYPTKNTTEVSSRFTNMAITLFIHYTSNKEPYNAGRKKGETNPFPTPHLPTSQKETIPGNHKPHPQMLPQKPPCPPFDTSQRVQLQIMELAMDSLYPYADKVRDILYCCY